MIHFTIHFIYHDFQRFKNILKDEVKIKDLWNFLISSLEPKNLIKHNVDSTLLKPLSSNCLAPSTTLSAFLLLERF